MKKLIVKFSRRPAVFRLYALSGSGNEIARRIVNRVQFEDPHYNRLLERHITEVVRCLRAADEKVTTTSLIRCMCRYELQDVSYDIPPTGDRTTDPGVWIRTYVSDLSPGASEFLLRTRVRLRAILGE
jgi:hypothetical protein